MNSKKRRDCGFSLVRICGKRAMTKMTMTVFGNVFVVVFVVGGVAGVIVHGYDDNGAVGFQVGF